MTQDQLVSLVTRAISPDPDAWEALYRRAYPGLMAYASRRLDRERASDAVAETMARAIANIDRFEWKGGGFDAWLYGILRHVVVDAHRARSRDAERRERDEPRAAGPLDHVVDNEDAAEVRAAFGRLGNDDRELLELRVVAGLTAEDVGKVAGKTTGGGQDGAGTGTGAAAARVGARGVSSQADDQLLDRLGAALAQTPIEPRPAEIEAIRGLVAVVALPVARVPREARRHPFVTAAAAVVIGLVVVGGLIALSTGAPAPSSPRPPIGALGVPIDSVGLTRVRIAMSELRLALAGPDDTSVAAARDRLEARLRSLDPASRREVGGESRILLDQAVARLGGSQADGGLGTPSPTSADAAPETGTVEPVPGSGATPTVTTTPGSSAGSGTGAVPEDESPTQPEGTATTEPLGPPGF